MTSRVFSRSRMLRPRFLGIILACGCIAQFWAEGASNCTGSTATEGVFSLRGVYEPQIISGRLMARALLDAPQATVVFLIDGKEIWRTSEPPYDLGPRTGESSGLDVKDLSPGHHLLSACAMMPAGTLLRSAVVPFTVIPDISRTFSESLTPYAPHPTVLDRDIAALLGQTATIGATLSDEEVRTRRLLFGVYLDFGIDPSLDIENDQSSALAARLPSHASVPGVDRGPHSPSTSFSRDSVFYHSIPRDWPRIPIPRGYFKDVQFSTAYGGDGIGFGEVVASASDPLLLVRSQWYDVKSTLRTFHFRMPLDWDAHLPTNAAGDRHLIFIDPASQTFISCYKASKDPSSGAVNALFASSPHRLDGLGDSGGSIAAGFAELAVLVQPGEATDPEREIPHAIGGALGRTWAARVYPATSRDAGVRTSTNTCTHKGFTNSGVVPYGGIIQLDPELDLTKLKLSLPSYRILRAMQVYGYYVMDFGCADLDIYTAMDAAEVQPYGGSWGNENGPGVQNEIRGVITQNKLYIVPPPIKR